MAEDSVNSRMLYELGISTELAKSVEEFFVQPHEFLDKMRLMHNDLFSQLFMISFMHLVKQCDLYKTVSSYAVKVNGADISLWIILKDSEDTFENRSKFYRIVSQLSNIPQFEKINVDFLLLTEGELHIPESFKHTKA